MEQKGHDWTSRNALFDGSTAQNTWTAFVLSFVGLLYLINRRIFLLLGDNDPTNQKPFFYNDRLEKKKIKKENYLIYEDETMSAQISILLNRVDLLSFFTS